MNIHFSHRRQSKNNDPVIVLNVNDSRFPHRKFSYSTGHPIAVGDWKKAKGLKTGTRGFPKDKPELVSLIEHLRTLERSTNEWLRARYNSKSLNREDLRKHLESTKRDERKEREEQVEKEVDFFQVWRTIVDTTKAPKSGQPITFNGRKAKLQTLRRVTQFSLDTGFVPTFLNIDMRFYHAFDQYMINDRLSPNSRGKHFKEIKALLREATERNYPVNQDYKKKFFRVIKIDVDNTFLSLDEIKKIDSIKVGTGEREITARQAELRDIFVAACFVGLRYSDWRQIHPDNVVQEGQEFFLKIKQQKTGEIVHAPMHPAVRNFIKRYQEDCPKIISNQKFNETIKAVCKKALLDENNKPITVALNGEKVEKWTAISSHTVRRSMATNMFMSGDLNIYTIRQITGHRSEASFMKYLKLNGRDSARMASQSKFFSEDTWTSLKIA